ncbi:MAG: hypothetical protein ACI8QZ_000626 [Chlamydiales bacterium]|jgi:hypothetical protein
MRNNLRDQLARLDRAILALFNERARLVAEGDESLANASIEDLLRRSEGPFGADALREAFRWIDAGCSTEGEGRER